MTFSKFRQNDSTHSLSRRIFCDQLRVIRFYSNKFYKSDQGGNLRQTADPSHNTHRHIDSKWFLILPLVVELQLMAQLTSDSLRRLDRSNAASSRFTPCWGKDTHSRSWAPCGSNDRAWLPHFLWLTFFPHSAIDCRLQSRLSRRNSGLTRLGAYVGLKNFS